MTKMTLGQWLFARDLIDELDRWRSLTAEFRRWLAGAHDVDFVLAHIEAGAKKLPAITGCEGQSGPHDSIPVGVTARVVRQELQRRAVARRDERERREAERVREEVRRLADAAGGEALQAFEHCALRRVRFYTEDQWRGCGGKGWLSVTFSGERMLLGRDVNGKPITMPTMREAAIATHRILLQEEATHVVA